MRKLRISSQIFFLSAFVLLFITMDIVYLRDYPIRWFFDIDPLVAIGETLASRQLARGALWALLTLILTALFGRFFCGWVCPFGSMHYASTAWFDARPIGQAIRDNRFRPIYNLKYYLLVLLLAMAAFGHLQIGWFDPIAFVTRAMAVLVHPLTQGLRAHFPYSGGHMRLLWIGGAIALASALLAAGFSWITSRAGRGRVNHIANAGIAASIALAIVILGRFNTISPRFFHWGFLIGIAFIGILALNKAIPHFWCRALCPLGALLGLVGRISLGRIQRNADACTSCKRCVSACPGACDPDTLLRKSECVLCMNCREICPDDAITYRFLPGPGRTVQSASPNLDRRRILGSLGLGALIALMPRAGSASLSRGPRDRIRPPGSLPESDFLAKCIKCGACMKICPTNIIQPALAEAGIEGVWTPILIFRQGACETECVLCGKACPTGAIAELTMERKMGQGEWEGNPVRVGTAFLHRSRCLPWSSGRPCSVCQEVCPVSPKAVQIQWRNALQPDGTTRRIQFPTVEPSFCIGCGTCEAECPVHDQSAIRVTSVGETRSRENQMLLGR